MLFHIRHRLDYTYDQPVFLEPMTLRLTPRQDASQRLLSHSLRIVEPPWARPASWNPMAVMPWCCGSRRSDRRW